MALTHQDIQNLHSVVRDWKNLEQGTRRSIMFGGPEYEIINSENSATEAIAVAPLNKEGKPGFSQTTTIAFAGT
ncbi:hypothetical protein [Streptococcus gordonii]|jgi:hypothetical protein|uniref:hypothetical protein n=1 Tax=Streptococcus gordonii TaxID=1302 RepID=UPI000BBD406F|nr:hypothetical protein [Streptococcus gordonii]ATF65466.1 hypothetical protein CO687_08355 [Streptococcus gordonii]MCY7136731.1 hypothetical protein [Streptococcus gordonii]